MSEPGDRYADAVAWAIELHAGQVRKATQVPYVAHLLGVSSLVLEGGGDEEDAIAGLLHDCLEDTVATRHDVEERFGPRVAAIVAACSDTEVRPKPPWRDRKVQFLERLDQLGDDRHVLLVVAADKVHNLRSILLDHRQHGDDLWARFNAGPADQLWYYGQVADRIRSGLGGPLADELDALVTRLAEQVT